jgi:hypothetical protein
MNERRYRHMIRLIKAHRSENFDIDITFQMKPGAMTTNFDALLDKFDAQAKLTPPFHLDHIYPHHGRRRAPCLRFCEALVSLTAPKGRIDELLGDHQKELQDLISQHGERWGVWIRRLRLISETCRMLPTIALRVWAVWRATR